MIVANGDRPVEGLARTPPRGWIASLAEALLEWALPRVCAGCGAPLPGSGKLCLCVACWSRIPWLGDERIRVGKAVEPVCAAVEYRDPIESWLRRYKYPGPSGQSAGTLHPGPEAIALTLIAVAARRYAREASALPDAVVAIPSPAGRVRERGFHPAGVLARSVGKHLGRPVLHGVLLAPLERPSQTGLSRGERRSNVTGAFCASPTAELRGSALLLVDDIVTTGATLASAGATLRRAGARRIDAVCVAHAPMPR